MTCAKLVGLKSPEFELTVTPVRSMSAWTVVNRTRQSLKAIYMSHTSHELTIYIPFVPDHLKEVFVVHYLLEDRAECQTVVPTEGCRKSDDRYTVSQLWRFKPLIRILDRIIEMR